MSDVIRNKVDMYRRLAAGEFGNTIRQWFCVEEWEAYVSKRIEYAGEMPPALASWGVRTLTPGGPCLLYCPFTLVRPTVQEFERAGHRVNISQMIDVIYTITAWLEVWDSPTGLVVEGIEYPARGDSWRARMPVDRRAWQGTAAKMILRKHLNPNAMDDLESLIARYPGHVIELSACEECVGVVPDRNAVVWECRQY